MSNEDLVNGSVNTSLIFTPVNNYSNGIVATVAGTRFIVGSNDADTINALSEYLYPNGSTSRNPGWVISTEIIADERYEQLRRFAPGRAPVLVKQGFQYLQGDTEGILCYASDTGFEDCPHLIFLQNYRVSIFGVRLNETFRRLPLRIIRELALRQCENEHGLLTHAACAKISGRGMLIVGNSGAGKTTTLMNLLSSASGIFVANDRGICRLTSGRPYFETWPTAIRVGAGTASAFGNLLRTVNKLRRRENVQIRENVEDAEQAKSLYKWASRKKFEFTPQELCRSLSCEALMGTDINLVIFPNLALNDAPLELTIPTAEDWSSLRDCLTTPVDAEWGRGWLGVRTVSDSALCEAKTQFIDEIVRSGRALRLTGDPRRMTASSILEALVGASKALAVQTI